MYISCKSICSREEKLVTKIAFTLKEKMSSNVLFEVAVNALSLCKNSEESLF